MKLSRRDVLRLAGAGAAGLALGCGDNEPSRPPGVHHASLVLEPDTTAFSVAVWSSLSRSVAVSVRDSSNGEVLATMVDLDAAGRAVIDVTDLVPSTTYTVELLASGGTRLGPHTVRTAPSPDDPRPVRLAVSADLDPSPEFVSDLLEQLAAAAPEVYVSIGDFPYTDNGPPAMTVPEYRARHAELRTSPPVRACFDTMGVRAIYDDHEFRNDWDAMWVAAEPDRYAAAMQVWDEFFPVRGATGEIRYRSWRWGANVECFLLDTRRFRSADAAPDDANKTMLGETQHAWLVAGVRASTATFKLIFTTVPLNFATGDDAWHTFTTERDRLFGELVGVAGVVFFSGDQHFFAAHRHAHGIREFQVGPLARGLGMPGPTAPGVVFRSVQYNFGLIDVDGEHLTVCGIGADGTCFYKEMLSASDLTPM
ncbi:MAG: alkaline phosphatase D family protein [Deltaproteobacteria bacterium]|nr:alkaline phosphatase D family protein [Deltaproteobacteria bacterium]